MFWVTTGFACFLLCGWDVVRSQRNPTISWISPERIMNIGETTEMKCSVQYASGYSVLWTKIDENQPSGSIPLSKGTSIIIPESRFALDYNGVTSTYTLTVRDIQETDAGVYQCQVLISTQNVISAEVKLSVRRPPVISDDSTRSVVATVGESVRLECKATGYPTPKVFWRKQNNGLLHTGSAVFRGEVLEIRSVTKDDRGTYYCVAENYVGKGARRNVALDVEFAPVITVPRPRMGQALQYDMDLECHIEAYPQPAITWVKDGFQLTNNQHYRISHFSISDEVTSTNLRVLSIEKKQYGQFECQAANKFGISSGKVELVETIIPICPPACGQNLYSGSGAESLGAGTTLGRFWQALGVSSAAVALARAVCPAA